MFESSENLLLSAIDDFTQNELDKQIMLQGGDFTDEEENLLESRIKARIYYVLITFIEDSCQDYNFIDLFDSNELASYEWSNLQIK